MAKRVIHFLDQRYRESKDGEPAYWCPVCKSPHRVAVFQPFVNESGSHIWTWNADLDHPTFAPSIHTYYDKGGGGPWHLERPGKIGTLTFPTEDAALAARPDDRWVAKSGTKVRHTVCHVHINNGAIQVLDDSERLGGQTLPLEEWEPKTGGP